MIVSFNVISSAESDYEFSFAHPLPGRFNFPGKARLLKKYHFLRYWWV